MRKGFSGVLKTNWAFIFIGEWEVAVVIESWGKGVSKYAYFESENEGVISESE